MTEEIKNDAPELDTGRDSFAAKVNYALIFSAAIGCFCFFSGTTKTAFLLFLCSYVLSIIMLYCVTRPGRRLLTAAIVACASLAGILIIGYMLRSNINRIIEVVISLAIAIPIIWMLSAVMFTLYSLMKKHALRKTVVILFAVSVAAPLLSFSLPLSAVLIRRDINEARAYCEALVPALEEHRKKSGIYPRDIGEFMSEEKPVPYLLTKNKFYTRTDDGGYIFDFYIPIGFAGEIHTYSSTTGKWTVDN